MASSASSCDSVTDACKTCWWTEPASNVHLIVTVSKCRSCADRFVFRLCLKIASDAAVRTARGISFHHLGASLTYFVCRGMIGQVKPCLGVKGSAMLVRAWYMSSGTFFVFLIKQQCFKSDVGCYREPLEAALGLSLSMIWDFPVSATQQNPRLAAPSSPGDLWCLVIQPLKRSIWGRQHECYRDSSESFWTGRLWVQIPKLLSVCLTCNIFLMRRNVCKLISPLTCEVLTKAYYRESPLSARDAFPSMKTAALTLFGFEFMSCAFICYGYVHLFWFRSLLLSDHWFIPLMCSAVLCFTLISFHLSHSIPRLSLPCSPFVVFLVYFLFLSLTYFSYFWIWTFPVYHNELYGFFFLLLLINATNV